MKRSPAATILLALLADTATLAATPLDDVLEADLAFAEIAERAGQQAAFLEYLADDAVLFRPEAVAGRHWLASHESASGRLEWHPAAAAVACTGDLAVSTGPWRYANGEVEPSTGHYLTVWRRAEPGDWRVVLDHGVEHSATTAAGASLATLYAALWPVPDGGRRCAAVDQSAALAQADEALNRAIGRRGLAAGLVKAAATDVVVYRDGNPPGRSSTAVPGGADLPRGTQGRAMGRIAVPHADLAVTHGVLESPGARGGAPGRFAYVRVWKLDARRWRLAIDMLTPLPAATAADASLSIQ